MGPTSPPEVLFLSLVPGRRLDAYIPLRNAINANFRSRYTYTASAAIQALEESFPRVVILVDEGLTSETNRDVLNKLVAYVRNGGVAMIAGLHFALSFSREFNSREFKRFFEAFDLPWEKGNCFYSSCLYKFNEYCNLNTYAEMRQWPQKFDLKVVNIKNARPFERIYIPNEPDEIERSVFAQRRVDPNQAAVTGAQIGRGYLLYIGDVNWEWESAVITLVLVYTRL
ncbi:hypothetical protein BJX64DRAFT_270592 [Aspergillus heterothallicus]